MKTRLFLALGALLCSQPLFALDIAPSAMGDSHVTDNSNTLANVATLTDSPIEGQIFGRIRSTLVLETFSQGATDYNYLDTTTDARFGYTAKRLYQGWMTSGTIDMDINSADSALKARYLYVTAENENLSFRVGRQEPGGSTLGNEYLQDIDESLTVGETIGDGDFFTLGFKPTGKHKATDDAGLATAERALAFFWEGQTAEQKFTLNYTKVFEDTDVKLAAKGGDRHAAERYEGAAAAWQIPVWDGASLSLNLDQLKKSYPLSRVQNRTVNTSILFLDQALTKDTGITLAVSQQNTADSSSPTHYSGLDLGYTYQFGLLRFYCAYNQTNTLDADEDTQKTSQFGLGMGAFFK